jgi:hypothetical protein
MLQVHTRRGRPQVFVWPGRGVHRALERQRHRPERFLRFAPSRHPRKENGGWVIHDNQSTNGVRFKDKLVPSARIGDGDQAVVGTFVCGFGRRSAAGGAPSAQARSTSPASADLGVQPRLRLEKDAGGGGSHPRKKARRPGRAYKNKVFEILVQVAKALISVDDVETVLGKVMDLIFEHLPVDRGFLLLEEDGGSSCASAG